jgi:hypothetical protein
MLIFAKMAKIFDPVNMQTTEITGARPRERLRILFYEDGSYTKMFGSKSMTIAYATTGEVPEYRQRRRQTMALWTRDVLKELHKENWADIFRFSSVDRESLFDLALFEKPVWYRPDSPTPRTLLSP